MRRFALALVSGAALLGSAATAGAAGSGSIRHTGAGSAITGRTVAGPTCPVEQNPPQPQCAPRPLSVRIRITRHGGHSFIVRSGRDGRFRASVSPGTYTVQGLPASSSGLPRPPGPATVQVRRGKRASVTLYYDTGIR